MRESALAPMMVSPIVHGGGTCNVCRRARLHGVAALSVALGVRHDAGALE
jgi:hypothetical protein